MNESEANQNMGKKCPQCGASLPAGALVLAFKTAVAPPTDLVAFSTASGVLSRALDPWRWGQLAEALVEVAPAGSTGSTGGTA